MRRSPFVKQPQITLPKLGTPVRIKQGTPNWPIPFGAASGVIVHIDADRSGGTTTLKVRLPSGVVVKGLSYADVVELESRQYARLNHPYDQAASRSEPHDWSAPSPLRPTANIVAVRPRMTAPDPARSYFERKASAYQRLSAEAHIQCRAAGSMKHYAAASRARQRYSEEARRALFTLINHAGR
jgi:hypothetical protein